MKTYLVPVDFSSASVHAAEYAAALSHQSDVKHIILLNAYYVSVYETTLPNPDMVLLMEEEIEQNAAERIRKLEELKVKLTRQVRTGVDIGIHLNRSHLVDAIVENVFKKHADLVILGSVGNTSTDDTQIGSHVFRISKASPVPVIVVPPTYTLDNIECVVLACDFTKVTETIPVDAFDRFISKRKLKLLVVNVDDKAQHGGKNAERLAEETKLYGMLKQYSPAYHYLNSTDIISGILKFSSDHNAQLVVALPHKYNFFQSLLHNSVSQQLAERSAIPVLLLK